MASYFGSSVNPADGGSATAVALTLTPPADMVEGQLVVITGIKRTSSLGAPFFSKTGGQDWRFFAEASASNANAVIGAVCIFNGTWTEAPELDLNTGAPVSAQMHVFSPASGKRFVIETCGAQVFGGGSSDMAVSPQALAGPSGIAIIAYHTQDDNQYSAPSTNWSNAGAQHYRNTSGVALACAYRTLNAPGSFGTCTVSQTTDGPDPGKALWLVAREVDAATEAEDDFNRADGSVGDDWSAILGSRGIIVSNQLTSSSGTQGAYYSAKAFRRAQFSEIEFVSGASGTFYVIVRFLPNFFRTGYSLGIDVAEGTWTLYNDEQIFTDSLITLATGELPDPVTSGDVYRLEIDDEGILSVYQNDTLVTTFEDHTYTGGGQPGYAVPSTIILDNWRGGELESDEGIDGTLTATEAADSAAVTGAVLIGGSLAATEAVDAAQIAGLVLIDAALAATESPDAANLTGDAGALTAESKGPAPAGRRRYYVEIDGQTFEVESPAHARAVLERARELAQAHAEQLAQREVPKRRKVGRRPVPLRTPRISSPDPELRDVIREARQVINAVYRRAAIDTELAFLLARLAEEDDEEILLLI